MNQLAHRMALVGAWSQVVLYAGIVVSLVVMSRAIGGMDFSQTNDMDLIMSQVSQVTQQLTHAVEMMNVAGVIAVGGLVSFLVALTRLQYRRRWAFWFSILHGGVLLFLFPLGTVFGVFLLIYAVSHHREFRGKVPVAVLCAEPQS
jgi:hypothetical protein